MRIAYLSRGNNVYDRRFLEKMLERGHKVFFISYHPSEKVKVEGVENYFYNYPAMFRFPFARAFQTSLHLRKLLKQLGPDVLHTGWIPDHGFFGALCGFKPTLSMPWGSDILIKPKESFMQKIITGFTLRRADKITCDAEFVKKEIVRISGCLSDKVIVFPWGIDLKTFCPLDGKSVIREKLGWQDKKILIMTRSMDKSLYGHETFISALPAIIEKIPDTRVILVGDGLLKEKIKKQVVALNLKDYIHFAGWINEGNMAEYLNAADIYVSVSISDGTSCSLLEAMACKLPVVVTDIPANREWVVDGQNGYLVPIKDVNLLSSTIIKILKNENLWESFGIKNRKIVEAKADWENNFSILEEIYTKLVDSNSGGSKN